MADTRQAGPWLTVDQAANYLAMTPKALRQACRRGRVRFHRLGRLIRFTTAELDEALQPCPTSTPTNGED
jgi:excisionase family DNA binding protein